MRLIALSILFVASAFCAGQSGTTELVADRKALIRVLGALTDATRDTERDSLNTQIKTHLRRLLEADDAFTADLDSVPLSRVDAPDGKFRLVTWNIAYSDGTHLYEGFLLVQDRARRVLYELRDMTEKITNPLSKKLGPDNWYGALYYTVIAPQDKGSKYYTLLGWKGHSSVETRKVIEVLSFTGSTPVFGAPVFTGEKTKHFRKVFGFGSQNSMSLRWDGSNKGIVLDHLAPIKPEFQGNAALMGPDLSFDAYVPYKGKWAFLRDVDARNMQLTAPSKRP